MCTVTFVRSGDKYIITSNRDESPARPALKPELYNVQQKKVYFPKDPQAGGTWFAVDESSNVLVLLNGAFTKHQHLPPYKKSRGLVVLDIIGSESPLRAWESIMLSGIEPFTLVVLEKESLFHLAWDFSNKHTLELNQSLNYIWSSATLYSQEVIETRKSWFQEFLIQHPLPHETDMIGFHMNTAGHDKQNGLIMNRDNKVKTQSVTQVVVEKNKADIFYHDVATNENFSNSFFII